MVNASDMKPKRKAKKTATSQLLKTSQDLDSTANRAASTTIDAAKDNNGRTLEPSIESLELPLKKKNAIFHQQLNLLPRKLTRRN